MTGEAFLAHIFLEEADTTMQKIATDILAKNPKGDIDALRVQVKQTEASLWYMHGSNRSGKQVREEGWCGDCKSSTHNTDQCWGWCRFCNFFRHWSSRCRGNPENKDVENGAVKKAGESVENYGANELTRAKKHRQNRLKKKKKRERKS